jgi:hypothetical protein
MKMFTTLYRSATPDKSVMEGEYYQPLLESAIIGGKELYFVKETHAWFDDKEKKVINLVTTLSPAEGIEDRLQAHDLFDKQVAHRVKEGFAHSFFIDPFAGPPNYRGYIYLG